MSSFLFICIPRGDDNFERKMETTAYLHCTAAHSRSNICAADQKQHGYFCRLKQAAAVSAGLAFPRGMDDSVCPDGNRFLFGSYLRKGAVENQTSYVVLQTSAMCQFLLAHLFFRPFRLLIFFYLASSFMDSYHRNDYPVLPDNKLGRLSDAALPFVGYFCRIFELFYLSFKLSNTGQPVWPAAFTIPKPHRPSAGNNSLPLP